MSTDNFDISHIMFELFDHTAESISVAGLDGHFLYVNLAGTMFGGRKFEDMVGKLVWEVYPDIAGSLYEHEFHRSVREQVPVEFEYYFPTRDKWFNVRFYPSPDAVAIFGIDITPRKQAEEAVLIHKRNYQLLIEAAEQGYALLEMIRDKDGKAIDYRFLDVNPGYERMSGLAEARGRTVRELVQGFEGELIERFGQVARTGESVRFEAESEGMGRVFDVFASAVEGDRIVILFTDVTTNVRQRQNLEALNERLRRAMQETHHRVKNNLQVITSLVEMQVSDMQHPAASASLQHIKQHIQTLTVIHDLLTQQAKTDATTDATMEYIDTDSVMARLLPLLQHTIGERSIIFHADNVILTVDKAASFALLVSECVSNAVKHGSGEIEITLKPEGKWARLEICDDGEGFPADFDPRRAANTGLQLIESAVRWDLRGDVQYDNHGLGGGRVVVTFPIEVVGEGESVSSL